MRPGQCLGGIVHGMHQGGRHLGCHGTGDCPRSSAQVDDHRALPLHCQRPGLVDDRPGHQLRLLTRDEHTGTNGQSASPEPAVTDDVLHRLATAAPLDHLLKGLGLFLGGVTGEDEALRADVEHRTQHESGIGHRSRAAGEIEFAGGHRQHP